MRAGRLCLVFLFLITGAVLLPGSAAAPAAAAAVQDVRPRLYLPLVSSPRVEIRVLATDFAFVSTISGDLHILGEVYNGQSYSLARVGVRASLYDRQGRSLPVSNPYAQLLAEDLPPGTTGCFDLVIFDPPASWYTYEIDELWYELGPAPTGITVVYSSAAYDSSGEYHIFGTVRNDSGRRMEGVKPVGTLYNSYGKVIGCSEAYVEGYHLNPGATGAFTIDFYGRNYIDAAGYQIQVHGYPQ